MKISFIIPVYNGEKYIERCLDSINVMNQFEWECIVVDDGSKDKTRKIIDSYEQENSRFKCLHIQNGGVSNARNIGIENATGELVFFLDSDDWLLEDAGDNLKKEIDKFKTGKLIVFDHMVIDSNGKKKRYGLPDIIGLSYQDAIKEIAVKNQKINNCWGVLLERELIIKNDIRFDKTMKVAEDTCFILEYLKYTNRIVINHNPILAYWQNESSVMHKTGIETIKDDEKCFLRRKALIEILDINIDDKEYGIMCNFYFSNTIGYISSECNNKKIGIVHHYIDQYANSSYGKELIEKSMTQYFSMSKKILVILLKRKMYWFCCVLMVLFEKKKTMYKCKKK